MFILILLSTIVSATQLIALSRAGTTEILEQGEKGAFFIEENKYHVTVEKILTRTMDIKIDSQEITLGINELRKIDLNNDYIYDVSVKLTGITENNVKLVFTSLIEAYSNIEQDPIIEVIEQEESVEESTEEETESFEITVLESEKLTELFNTYFKYVIAGVVILIVLIAVISMASKLKKKSSVKKTKKYVSDLFFEEVKSKKRKTKKKK